MKKTVYISIVFISFLFIYGCNQTSTVPVQVIFDTDLGPDYDDVGALAMLHALADNGEANILATISSNTYEYTPQCIDVINHYFGRSNLPIGIPYNGVRMEDGHKEKWTEALVTNYKYGKKNNNNFPDGIKIYRQILSGQADTSVTIITVGFLTNLSNLLQSPADEFSELDGVSLVKKKVKKLVSMAGVFPEGSEYNVYSDSAASVHVFNYWPTPIILSGFEIGNKIITGKNLVNSNIQNSPVKEAYEICLKQDDPEGRQSWDQTAVLVGVRGIKKYFDSVKGQMMVKPNGENSWINDPNGLHEYLIWKMSKDNLEKTIEDLMMHEPFKKK